MNRPVAYSSNARRTKGARSGSAIRLLPIARGAFRYPRGARNTHRPSSNAAFMPARVRSERTSLTYRKGRTFAAYLHLSHPTGEKSARTVASADGLLIVDYSVSGLPLGVEITAPQAVPLERLNEFLAELGESPIAEQDYRPARAA